MTKQIVQLHTLDQWFQVDPHMRVLILQNIKLKDRLQRWLIEKVQRPALTEPKWVACQRCEKKGWVELHPRYPGIHPSALTHDCLLKVYNELVGVPGQEKPDTRKQLTFALGHAVHDMFQSYGEAGAWGPIYKREVPISGDFQELAEDLMLEGSADAENILSVDIPDSPYIYEVGLVHEYKSIKTELFDKLTRPKPEHQLQATVYSAVLNRPVVVYLYFSKNDSNLADFPVEFKPDTWHTIERKAGLVLEHYESGIPPKGETGFHCQECPYVLGCQDYRDKMLRRRA